MAVKSGAGRSPSRYGCQLQLKLWLVRFLVRLVLPGGFNDARYLVPFRKGKRKKSLPKSTARVKLSQDQRRTLEDPNLLRYARWR